MVIHSFIYFIILFIYIHNGVKEKAKQKKKQLTLPYSLVEETWIVGPGNLPVLRTGINGT